MYHADVRDADIRLALVRALVECHDDRTLIVDEMALCEGDARIDVAVVNGALNGYEIKSERDTLCRLPSQCEAYGRAFDTLTIVLSGSHVDAVMKVVPEWWGILEAYEDAGEVRLRVLRDARSNPSVEAEAVAQLLWRDEVLDELRSRGLDKGLSGKSRRVLWQRLAAALPLSELGLIVRERLKARTRWRYPPSLSSGDARFRSFATSSRSRTRPRSLRTD